MISLKIGVITVPINKAGIPPVSHLLDILAVYSPDLYLLTGNDGYTFFKQDPRLHVGGLVYTGLNHSFLFRLSRYIWTQFFISCQIMRLRNHVDLWIFFIGGYRLHLPVFVAKILHKNVVLLLADSGGKHPRDPQGFVVSLPKILVDLPYSYADKIVVYSPRLTSLWGLEKFRNKISIAHEHFINFTQFKRKTRYQDRPLLIGYIGRLSDEKGIRNLIAAIPAIRTTYPGIFILIGGDGPLMEEIKAYVQTERLNDQVEFSGWISHDNLPDFLNRLRLLVLPSYTEGLPNIVLEAMACGTPVLATPVGAIPDIIIEGQTGFRMETNSPACISENIIRALHTPDIERIAENGRKFVQENYTFEKTAESWNIILQK
jgi:glycosyltransferase involved in cell wall biosynthesis